MSCSLGSPGITDVTSQTLNGDRKLERDLILFGEGVVREGYPEEGTSGLKPKG